MQKMWRNFWWYSSKKGIYVIKNSIEEYLNYLDSLVKEYKQFGNLYNEDYEDEDRIYQALEHILSDYKRVLKMNEVLLKENEKYKKQYFCLINRIENKIDKFDYEFEKAKRKNDNDRADYYWDLIRNFKKMLESEE